MSVLFSAVAGVVAGLLCVIGVECLNIHLKLVEIAKTLSERK